GDRRVDEIGRRGPDAIGSGVASVGQDEFSVRTEFDAAHARASLVTPRLGQRLARGRVPKANFTGVGNRRNPTAIWTEGSAPDRAGMRKQGTNGRTALYI